MADIYPYHSVNTSDPQVHHNNTRCHLGNNIDYKNIRPGTGDFPLCKVCAHLNGEPERVESIFGPPIPY